MACKKIVPQISLFILYPTGFVLDPFRVSVRMKMRMKKERKMFAFAFTFTLFFAPFPMAIGTGLEPHLCRIFLMKRKIHSKTIE